MSAGDYVGPIKAMGLRILAQADLGDYQGDWVGLVRDEFAYGKEFGFVSFGYGSCSGCDVWQSAATAAERAQVIADILRGAKWFDDLGEARDYIATAQANNVGYYVHEDGWPDFVTAATAADEWAQP